MEYTYLTRTYMSRSLSRRRPYAVLAPAKLDGPLPLVVLLHGLTGSYEDWPTRTRIARYVRRYRMLVALPDGENGWYTNSVVGPERYEDDFWEDFLPDLRSNFPLAAESIRWAIGGLSMGGYGAVKLALRRPDRFATAFSHSGSFATVRDATNHPVFGDRDRHLAERHAEDVFALAEIAMRGPCGRRPRLFLDCGTSDYLIEVNRSLHDRLNHIGYSHAYREMPGEHTWPYWDRAIRTILPTICEIVGAARDRSG